MIDIIFVNLHGTVLPLSGEPVVRRGFLDFVEQHGARRIVLTSYKPGEEAARDIKLAGLVGKFYKLCALECYPYYPQNNTNMPNYRIWAMDFETQPARTLVVTSVKDDLEQAVWYGVPAIVVPPFKTPEDSFSFDRVYVDAVTTKLKFLCQGIMGKGQIVKTK